MLADSWRVIFGSVTMFVFVLTKLYRMDLTAHFKIPLLYVDGMIRKRREAQRTALASFPRSGNTWLRNLIEKATGDRAGSIYRDKFDPRGRTGVVIKTHLRDSANYHRGIHLVRNPFDAIDSYFHYRRQIAGQANLTREKHIPYAANEWRRHTEHWLNARCDVHLLRYEALRADPVARLAELLDWLGRPADRAMVEQAVEACQMEKLRKQNTNDRGQDAGKFFRKGQVGKGIDAFTDEQVEQIRRCIGPVMAQLGYEANRATEG